MLMAPSITFGSEYFVATGRNQIDAFITQWIKTFTETLGRINMKIDIVIFQSIRYRFYGLDHAGFIIRVHDRHEYRIGPHCVQYVAGIDAATSGWRTNPCANSLLTGSSTALCSMVVVMMCFRRRSMA